MEKDEQGEDAWWLNEEKGKYFNDLANDRREEDASNDNDSDDGRSGMREDFYRENVRARRRRW